MQVRIVIFGAGGHAKVVIEAVRASNPEIEVAIIDDKPSSAAPLGLVVAGGRDWLADHWPDAAVFIALGNNRTRADLIEWVGRAGRRLATVLHPAATVSPSAELGAGSFVAAGAVITAEAAIGEGAIVNTMASIDHECEIGSSAHIAPGARLCGGVRVGARALVGAGAVIIPGVSVGADAVVGAGSVVVREVAAGARVAGSPARPI